MTAISLPDIVNIGIDEQTAHYIGEESPHKHQHLENIMGKVRYGQRGYVGSSMSARASDAYDRGSKPLSRITRADLQRANISESIGFIKWLARNQNIYTSEWHHTSKYANVTDFWDVEDIARQIEDLDLLPLKEQYLLDQARARKQREQRTPEGAALAHKRTKHIELEGIVVFSDERADKHMIIKAGNGYVNRRKKVEIKSSEVKRVLLAITTSELDALDLPLAWVGKLECSDTFERLRREEFDSKCAEAEIAELGLNLPKGWERSDYMKWAGYTERVGDRWERNDFNIMLARRVRYAFTDYEKLNGRLQSGEHDWYREPHRIVRQRIIEAVYTALPWLLDDAE